MPRIAWVDDAEAGPELTRQFAGYRARFQGRMPDILRTMSVRPDFMAAIDQAALLHFSDGALTRAQHEMIASYVAALNRCHY